MNVSSPIASIELSPSAGQPGATRLFGVMVTSTTAHQHLHMLSIAWLRELVRDRQLVVLRGFESFDDADHLTRFCATLGTIMMWPFGAVLELVEHANPEDHIFANSYVPLHWDGMYLDTVPEFQVFQCVRAPGMDQGGRTTFCSTTAALQISSAETRELWSRAHGTYQRSVKLYSNKARASIIEPHPRRGHPVLRFCEPPIEGDRNFINPSTYEFGGIQDNERQPLLDSLRKSLYDPRAHYAHRWQTGDVVIADNFTLIHGREAYAGNSGRHLRRVHIHSEPELRNPHMLPSDQATPSHES